MKYIEYNREERDICAHLFRLLLHDQPNWGPLKEFLGVTSVENPRIFCEVALIRDAYYDRKPDTEQFIRDLCEIIAGKNKVHSYTRFQDLPIVLRENKETHPKQISFKLRKMGLVNSEGDKIVYGTLQGMFNAKPDLAICTGSDLILYEAKYTSVFENEQLKRTEDIGRVWAELLYKDLGFVSRPKLSVKTIGMGNIDPAPDISWEKIFQIAEKYWGPNDFSVCALSKVSNTRRMYQDGPIALYQ